MNHLEAQVPELTTFWRTCILPEILGGWYTKKPVVSETVGNREGTTYYCREKILPLLKRM